MALHQSLDIADLHADTLLWYRSMLERSDRGQVDVPRMLDGNMAIQMLTVVTKSPAVKTMTPIRLTPVTTLPCLR